MGRTSVVDREKRRSAEALLQYIGLSPPLKATDSRRAPGSTLTRVNVLNRYLGYKACKYETKWAPSPNNPASGSNIWEDFWKAGKTSGERKGRRGNIMATIAQPTSDPTIQTRFKLGEQAAEF